MLTEAHRIRRLELWIYLEPYYVFVRGEPITIFSSQRKGPREFGPLVGLLVFAPLMAIAALVALPALPVVAWWERRKTRLLTDALTTKDRVMQWPEFVQALQEKSGTLMVEDDPRRGRVLG
jgi:hypothetical protein